MKSALLLFAFVLPLSACCGSAPPPLKGTIPPGTPPPEYEAPRAYDPSTAPPAAAPPAAPTAAPAAAPAAAPKP
ncbi:MAG: hypothetical protein U0441_11925 [Polyangiaceae bacterium]